MIDFRTDTEYKVYIHINKRNNKTYVGITKQEIYKRWLNGKAYKHCVLFDRAINKYGWKCFEHVVLAENLTKAEAVDFEKRLIKELQSNNNKFGYNITSGGEGTDSTFKGRSGSNNSFYGKHHNKEQCKKWSIERKGLFADSKNPAARKVICLNNLLIFDCISMANDWCGLKHKSASISFVCKGKRDTAGKDPETGEKLKWKYLEEYYDKSQNCKSG